ncbi:MAG: hypothetical protein PHU03_06740, partial [Syntrophales bacterium]|nr:hypothetical protein [Syntrophales bacterium]
EAKHHLYYRPVHNEDVNYILANQCGHILRLMEIPEDQRFMPVANKRTMMSYILEMEDEFKRLMDVFGPEKIRRMVRLWYEGVVFQLTKMPPDIMIDKWLYDKYPDLREIQLASLIRQRQEALQSLSRDTTKFTPEKIYRVSNIMNFAFFKVLEDHFRLDWVAPYHGTIFILEGSALAKITENEYVNGHRGDRIMIDTWAGRLGLTTWYEWKPLAGMQ